MQRLSGKNGNNVKNGNNGNNANKKNKRKNNIKFTYCIMEKFQNKYRIPSARLQHWDYRWSAAYFITICTQNRIHYFGEIENGKRLSNAGVLANVFWYEIKTHTKNVELGEFVVMPNHIHGILILNMDNTPL